MTAGLHASESFKTESSRRLVLITNSNNTLTVFDHVPVWQSLQVFMLYIVVDSQLSAT